MIITWKSWKWASLMAVTGLLLTACGSQVAETRKSDDPSGLKPQAVLEEINIQEQDGKVTFRVETSRKVTYSLYQQDNPLRLVMEFPQTSVGRFDKNIPVNSGTVSFIKPATTDRGGSHLEFFLSAQSTYDINGSGTEVTLSVRPVPSAHVGEQPGSPAAIVEETSAQKEEEIQSKPLASAAAMPAAEAAADVLFVTALDVRKDEGGTVASIRGDGDLQFEYFLVDGKSLVVDIFNAGNKIWPTVRKVDDAYVEQIRIGEHFQPEKKVRIVFDLKDAGNYTVRKGAGSVNVSFGSPSMGAAAAMGAPSPSVTVTDVYFRPLANMSRIEVKSSAPAEFKVVDAGDPLKIVVDLPGAVIEPKAEKAIDLTKLNRSVSKITAFQYEKDEAPVVRVVAQLKEAVPFRVAASGDTIAIDVNVAVGMPAAAAAAPSADEPVRAGEVMAADEPMEKKTGPKVYSGQRLSLDFMDADVNDILRLIADVSGMNFVAGPEVKGKVSIRLADVPWDQALDIILKTNVPPLSQVQESDTIVRVTTLDKIEQEEEAKRRAAEQKMKNQEAQKKLEPLVTRQFSISYADINDLMTVVKSFTSDRVGKDGLLTKDERTNTIIVRDLQENVDEIALTVIALDSPTPAVIVEARIVELNTSDANDLGVQWGAGFAADQAHGNALPFEFPNSVGVAGTQGTADGSSTPFMVNLPAAAATSGIGVSFGHIANTLSLDLRLQAMETMSKVRILSTPRVLVVQNETAKINVGQELPIPATDAEGNRTVTWREVGISLEVTPQVTNDGRVFMDIKVAKESAGDTVNTTEGAMFSINSKKAETQVLIADGETAVIGGLAEELERDQESRTPGLGSIPVLGWLFKQRSKNTSRQELMIFLTPKIVDVM